MTQTSLYTNPVPNARRTIKAPGRNANLAFLLFIFYSSFIIHHSSFPQQTGFPLIRNYSPKEYGGVPQAFSVLQDKNTGIMYFGIVPGVFSYDGLRWAEIPITNKQIARSLCQTDDGKIYAAAADDFGYLASDPRGKTVFRSLARLLPDSTQKIGIVWSVKATANEVFFNANQKIYRYLPGENKLQTFAADTFGRFYGGFVHNGIYHIRLSKKGLMKIENGKMTEAPNAAFFNGKINFYKGAVTYNENTQLIATRTEGVFLYEPQSAAAPQAFPLQDKTFLPDKDIYCAAALPKNRFLLGSLKQGALLIDAKGNTLQRFNESNLLQINGVCDINTDNSGNLWLGLSNGLSKTGHGQDWGFWDKNAGLKRSVLAFDRYQNSLYAATGQQICFLDEDYRPQEVKGIPVGQNWVLKAFLPPGEGKTNGLLIAGSQTGLYQVKDAQAVQLYKGGHALVLLQSKPNPARLYSTDDGNLISLLYQNGQWIAEGKWLGIQDEIRGIAEEENGTLWLGTLSNGVIKVVPDFEKAPGSEKIAKPKSIRNYTDKDGLPSMNNNRPRWLQGKVVWATEKGLYAHHPENDRFEPFCGLGKQFCDGSRGVYFLQEMQNGKIYISPLRNKNEDIGYLKPDGKGGYEWVFKPFRRLPEIAEIGAMQAEENGLLWLAGSEGLFRYDEQEDDKKYGMGFNCWIREVRAAGDSAVFYGGGPVNPKLPVMGPNPFKSEAATDPAISKNSFEHTRNTLNFLFAAPFFDNEERTLYSYRLEGFDEKWSEWSRHTEKEYTGLWEGEYVFKVKAKNIYEVESETDSYAFTVMPPFYRAWWAYSLYALLAAAAVWVLVRYNTRRLVLQKMVLERTVEQRTLEISQQAEELQKMLEKVEIEKEKSDKLLLNILPKDTADELKEKGRASTKYYEKVSVLFTDFKGFTQMTERMHPEEVVENLNHCFTAFDRICKKHRIEKIKTIGDSYMCAAGIPAADEDNPERMVEAALEMLAFMQTWKAEKAALGVAVWDLRLGIHTGPIMAGVVGENKFAYDIWGDTVNTASRMESSGEPSMINISAATYELVKHRFRCSYRGEITAKNKGKMGMYFVN